MVFRKDELLAPYTTFKIGGPAKYFCDVASVKEVKEAVQKAHRENLPYFVLGEGSNILVFDQGFSGLVIRISGNKFKVHNCIIEAEAGIRLAKLVNIATNYSLTGLEFAAGIPGTLGGAIRGNAGAWGQSISNVIKEVIVLRDQKKIKLTRNECGFSYRHSIFKENKDVILEASILLEQGKSMEIEKEIKANIEKRKKFQDLEHYSSGCVFKNVKTEMTNEQLKARHIDLDKLTKDRKISAGYLIERLDLKGFKVGGAQVSTKHANFIINTGRAKAEDVVILMSIIEQKVRNKFGIQLEKEIELVGF